MECGFDTHKNALIENLVILFVFFCAVEPIYSIFKPIGFLIYRLLSAYTISFLNSKYTIISMAAGAPPRPYI